MVVCSVSNDLFSRTSLCAYARNEEEVVRTEAAELSELVSLCRTYDKHHIVRCRDLHHLLHYCLIQRLSILLRILELICGSV